MNTVHDYSQYAEPKSTDGLAQLSKLATDQLRLESEILQAEKRLDTQREDLRILSEKTIPELMESLGIKEFSTNTGLKIKIDEAIRASIPKARFGEAIEWLDQNGFANLVKRKFVILFGKEEEKWASRFEADLRRRKRQLNVDRVEDVHSQTLKAFVREQLEAGKPLPMELFGVFRQQFAKIEVKK